MSRLIDADLLKAGFEEDGHLSPYIEGFIDACPTVDPVKHGEFERLPEECIPNFRFNPILCKTCNTTFVTINKEGVRAICCPYCGAHMKVGKDDA